MIGEMTPELEAALELLRVARLEAQELLEELERDEIATENETDPAE